MAAPLATRELEAIMDYDFDVLSALLDAHPGETYYAGLGELTRKPMSLEQVPQTRMPWLLQTDGDSADDFQAGCQVKTATDLIYLGYVRPDKTKFGDMSAPEIRRAVMKDVLDILDQAKDRSGKVFDRERSQEVFDDPLGEWALFIITETVFYYRQI
jgi:hypothetical protein